MQELYAHNSSPLHRMDARVKVIFTLAFLVFMSLTPGNAWPAYILLQACVLSVILISRLGLIFVLKRAFWALPFIFAAIPLVFSGQPPKITLFVFYTIPVSIHPEGLERFVVIALKSWISVQAAVLLAATTRFPDLLFAFQQLKIPKVFVAIIGLMWRYLFVIHEEAVRLLRARSSRSGAMSGNHLSGGSVIWRASVTGGMAGNLFLRSVERSDRIYAAMLSRGYSGELPISEAKSFTPIDYKILAFGFFVLGLIWMLGVLVGG